MSEDAQWLTAGVLPLNLQQVEGRELQPETGTVRAEEKLLPSRTLTPYHKHVNWGKTERSTIMPWYLVKWGCHVSVCMPVLNVLNVKC